MRLISWNVNGLRSCLGKGFLDFCAFADADVICLQETKMRPEQAAFDLPGYHRFWNSADKAGYSGTAIFTRRRAAVRHLRLRPGYPPARGTGHHRRSTRIFIWCAAIPPTPRISCPGWTTAWSGRTTIRAYLLELDGKKPVVYCGDLNVAHQEIDLKNPKTNRMNPGFSDEERAKMTQLLASGFADTFRTLYPDRTGAYSWWSYRFHARQNNAGWRIDYFIVSQRLLPRVKNADIWPEITGSDHCPVVLELTEE